MRTMFDSTTAADIPAGSELVMGYIDGSSRWSSTDWQRFPGLTLVRLCIFNDRMDAQVIDIEPGNNDALNAVPWIRGKWARGETPTVYCFSDRGPTGYRISDVRSACDALNVKRPLILITDFDNNPGAFDPTSDPEIIGKQHANSDLTGGHYDASVVADFWPGVDPDGGDMTAQETYDLIAPLLQQKIVAPQADTNTAIKAYIDAVAAQDKAAIATALTKVAQALERGALLLSADAAKP